MNKNVLIAVGGKSGCGKTTLVNALIKCFPSEYERPISCTTRSKRSGENNGEYDFISHSEFVRLTQCNEFLNTDHVYGNYYAIKTKSIIDVIKNQLKKSIHRIMAKSEKHSTALFYQFLLNQHYQQT